MLKIKIDPGHGFGTAHNRGSKIGNEGDNNWKISILLKKYLEEYGFYVSLTRAVMSVGGKKRYKGW